MSWRLAKSLEKLRQQVNDAWPRRSKVSDGTIGDSRHAASKSDHNPDGSGVVRALDITHDPAEGPDSEQIAKALLASRDPRIKYIISNKKIASGKNGPSPWLWRPYSGANAHARHVHISVVAGALGDDTQSWQLTADGRVPPNAEPAPLVRPVLRRGDKGDAVKRLQLALASHGRDISADGDFGPKTEAAVRAFQSQRGLTVDGIVGPRTWAVLG